MDNNQKKKCNNKERNMLIVVLICIILLVCVFLLFAGTIIFTLVSPDNNADSKIDNRTLTQSQQWHEPEKTTTVLTNADEFIAHIEAQTGFEFPDNYTSIHHSDYTEDWDTFSLRQNQNENTLDYFCCYFPDDVSQEDLEKLDQRIAQDERFIESLGDLKILIDSVGGDNIDEYKMVYVIDNGEFNTMPDTAGEYRIITVFYDVDTHSFSIEEFNNKYWKLENRNN